MNSATFARKNIDFGRTDVVNLSVATELGLTDAAKQVYSVNEISLYQTAYMDYP